MFSEVYNLSKLLIFPCSTNERMIYDFCNSINKPVVMATSEDIVQYREKYNEVVQLPYIYESDFVDMFLKVIDEYDVDCVYSPVSSVHAFLEDLFERRKIEINFIKKSPIDEQELYYKELFLQSDQALGFINVVEESNQLSSMNIGAILRQADFIYGESNHDKLCAMIAIFASAPKGDVVEIGSLMGRTAFVLCYLSNYYEIGSVLAIDPWSEIASVQQDVPELVDTTLKPAWDFNLLNKAFITNILSINRGRFNYLRMTSEDGYDCYLKNNEIASDEFGVTKYEKQISVIHIDGNHDYAFVSKDCELWLPRLRPGAWLILDDYLWAHGNGPKLMGDKLLSDAINRINRAFVCGKALFIQFI